MKVVIKGRNNENKVVKRSFSFDTNDGNWTDKAMKGVERSINGLIDNAALDDLNAELWIDKYKIGNLSLDFYGIESAVKDGKFKGFAL